MVAYVSYLDPDKSKRLRAQVGLAGKIHLKAFRGVYPSEFIRLFFVQAADPFLNLVDGDKLRVYYGGDPTQLSVQAAGVMENHVTYFKTLYESSPNDTLEMPYDWGGWGVDTDF